MSNSIYQSQNLNGTGLKIGIVTSLWNEHITKKLQTSCIQQLQLQGVSEEEIYSIEVPGAYELPFGAKLLLEQEKLDAVICLGCVIKGETPHDEYINQSVSKAIMQLGLASSKPVIFGLLTTLNESQALERAGGSHGDKGKEAAETAIIMVQLSKKYKSNKKGIGFG